MGMIGNLMTAKTAAKGGTSLAQNNVRHNDTGEGLSSTVTITMDGWSSCHWRNEEVLPTMPCTLTEGP